MRGRQLLRTDHHGREGERVRGRAPARLRTLGAALALAVAGVVSGGGGLAAAAGPSVSVAPAPVATGSQVTVAGMGFCATAGCSPVTVRIGQRVAASGVAVSASGTFAVQVQISDLPDQYVVSASQTGPGGDVKATVGLLVLQNDRTAAPTPTAQPTPRAGASPPPGGTTAPPATPVPTGPPGAATPPQATGSAGAGGALPPGGRGLLVVLGALAAVAAALVALLLWRRMHA